MSLRPRTYLPPSLIHLIVAMTKAQTTLKLAQNSAFLAFSCSPRIDVDFRPPRIIDNRLWRDEKRSLPIARPRFRAKVGWNDHV